MSTRFVAKSWDRYRVAEFLNGIRKADIMEIRGTINPTKTIEVDRVQFENGINPEWKVALYILPPSDPPKTSSYHVTSLKRVSDIDWTIFGILGDELSHDVDMSLNSDECIFSITNNEMYVLYYQLLRFQ